MRELVQNTHTHVTTAADIVKSLHLPAHVHFQTLNSSTTSIDAMPTNNFLLYLSVTGTTTIHV